MEGEKDYIASWYDEGEIQLEDELESIRYGSDTRFRFRGRDYVIDWLFIGTLEGEAEDGYFLPYPGVKQPNNFEEFRKLRFLDGMTFEEAFDELRFFES
jgi:hypothetical protein